MFAPDYDYDYENMNTPSTTKNQSKSGKQKLNPAHDADWELIATDFCVRPGTIYLNHGSFGIPSNEVRYAQRSFRNETNENPMDFFLFRFEELLKNARTKLAEFVGTTSENLALVDNATYAVSLVAAQFPLSAGDEVLITDHEYIPVARMWQQHCDQTGAMLVTAALPERIESVEQVIESLLAKVTDSTKILIVSHITSPTGLILPIKEICQAFADREIAVCVDGPHAPAQVDLKIDDLKCDFYAASCHKWLSAPLGTGFLYVHPKWQSTIAPLIKGWGRLPPGTIDHWADQFLWSGTRDVSHFLAIPAAIDYLTRIGLDNFRARSYWLASDAETKLREQFKTEPIARREDGWYGTMAHVPLPPGDWSTLQRSLKSDLGIEVMINQFAGRWFVRVSGHLYNNTNQIDALVKSLVIHCG